MIEKYGEVVMVESFKVWRDWYEVEFVLEKVKLMLDVVLLVIKEKKIFGC